MKDRIFSTAEKPRFLGIVLAGLIAGALFIFAFIRSTDSSLICSLPFIQQQQQQRIIQQEPTTPTQLNAILHYATSKITPQQSLSEIKVSFNVLKSLSPCNFLVFGLGFDSLMWNSFNPQGKTIFLEEDPTWVKTVLKDAPSLHAHTVQYQTRLDQADNLLRTYKKEPYCLPSKAFLKNNKKCKLALNNLPDEIYNTQWDLIMIDAPRGYAADLPGRMAAIFSAAVMARRRSVNSGVTHVFLHDVNRRVEKIFALEFLCKKYLVKAVGRLWHFEIPPAANVSDNALPDRFC